MPSVTELDTWSRCLELGNLAAVLLRSFTVILLILQFLVKRKGQRVPVYEHSLQGSEGPDSIELQLYLKFTEQVVGAK